MGAKRREARNKKRVLIVEDHPLVRERLAELIQQEPDLIVCGEAEDSRQALEAVIATRAEVVLVDLTLNGSHGLDLVKDLHRRHPELPMVVISMHEEALYAERVIHAGAHGYVNKRQSSRNVTAAIRAVLAGRPYFSEPMLARLTAKLANHPRARGLLAIDSLADRELRVFELLGQGRGTRQIARELGLRIRTVETYRARIKAKLHLSNANDLLQHAIRWSQTGGVMSDTTTKSGAATTDASA